jgi:hypothetical protein
MNVSGMFCIFLSWFFCFRGVPGVKQAPHEGELCVYFPLCVYGIQWDSFIFSTFIFIWLCVCVCIYIYIQGDSGRSCATSGNYSMSDSKQKSSYEHGSDFERLRSYGHFSFPYTLSCEPRLRLASITFAAADSPSQLQTVYVPAQRSSQLSGSLCCGRRRHFRKPALSTDQFKLKVISRC